MYESKRELPKKREIDRTELETMSVWEGRAPGRGVDGLGGAKVRERESEGDRPKESESELEIKNERKRKEEGAQGRKR